MSRPADESNQGIGAESGADERSDPGHAPIRRAVALLQKGRMVEAERAFAEALRLEPDNPDAHFGRALCLEATGHADGAEQSYRRACAIRPAFFQARSNLGALLLQQARPSEALQALEEVLRSKPEFPPARFNRAMACFALGRMGEAEAEFRRLLEESPGHADVMSELGRVLLKQSRVPEAIDVFRDGCRRHAKDPRFLVNLARALEFANEIEAAEEAASEALALAPDSPTVQFALACLEYRRGKLSQARGRLEDVLAMKPLSTEEESDALLELGQVLDELGEYQEAFAAISKGKALRRELPAVVQADGDRFLSRVAAAHQFFTRDRIKKVSEHIEINSENSLVFFVGFPRSGTTLMEQALKAHPRIVTTDERSPLEAVVRELGRDGAYPASLERLPARSLADLRKLFFEGAKSLFGPIEGRVLVDKMPLNIVHLGLVNCLFPDARVLVALRDPRDVCLSCFMQRFLPNDAMVNFLDLGRTADTYCAVMELWLHYRRVLSLDWLEYRYENLVADFEGVSRAVTDFIGLPWDAAVAEFRETSGLNAPTTPSYRQVVRETYATSVGRWRRYETGLAPILPALEPLARALGYDDACH